jgi:hypothetical protein
MQEFIKDKIIGTWKLVSWKYNGENDTPIDFFGADTGGILMYDKSGYMNAQLNKANRARFKSESLTEGTSEEITEAYLSYAAYYGKYYEKSPGEIVHVVEGSLFPNWLGHEEIRYGKIEGEYLILSTPPIQAKAKKIVFTVTWKRA